MRIFATDMLAAIFIGALLAVKDANDTTLTPSRISVLKEAVDIRKIPSPVSQIRSESLKREGIFRPNQLSSRVPGLFIPDYGASLTSTIYLRGLGSRMENPVMALYVDGIPVLDKNSYDTDWNDVRSATLVRGPQGTLYGRNSMAGVLSVSTLSPSDHDGFLGALEYGTANTIKANASAFFGNNVLSAGFRHGNGFFKNTFKGSMCDPYDGISLRWKHEKALSERIFLSNSLSASASREGGFAYGRYSDGILHPVSYNDEGSYGRLSILEGLTGRYSGEKLSVDMAASVQFLSDDMKMDQDFTPEPVFTLRQKQLSGAGTLEAILRKNASRDTWIPATGFSAFWKGNRMEAPVLFKEAGIRTLMEDNANRNIPSEIGSLDICDSSLPVNSGFRIRTWGSAIFHESVWNRGNWQVTAGIRLDYEAGTMDYDCNSLLHYRFVPIMKSDRELGVPYSGRISQSSLQILPKFSAMYEASEGLLIFTSVSKGYRAGGFNTQIFSDILQNLTMNALMDDLGVHLDRPSVSVGAANTKYSPETAWNYEIGLRGSKSKFKAEAGVYLIDVRNQQLTVFPPGMSTGRMMTNAGRSRSIGGEMEASWASGRFDCHISLSGCDARFVEFNDGNNDWSGKHIPYAPATTTFLGAGYWWPVSIFNSVSFRIDGGIRGHGPVWWNEANTIKEAFKVQLDGRAALSFDKWEIYVRGTNLTGTEGMAFYFKSVGKEFFSKTKPRIILGGITINI